MPLESGNSKAAFKHNIEAERNAGKSEKQSVAIAYAKQRGDQFSKAVAAGEREAEAQKQARALLEGKHVSGRDRARLKR